MMTSWWDGGRLGKPQCQQEIIYQTMQQEVFIIYDEDTPVCAGFVYNTNSSIAWCEFIVTNFEYKDRKKREECLNILGAKITEAAKDAGKGYLMTLLRSELLKKVCKDQGYLSMKDGYTNMIKIL